MDKLDEIREIIRSIPSKSTEKYVSCSDNCPFGVEDNDYDAFCTLFKKCLPFYKRLPECIKEFGFKTEEE